jgi:hypothetical protein
MARDGVAITNVSIAIMETGQQSDFQAGCANAGNLPSKTMKSAETAGPCEGNS